MSEYKIEITEVLQRIITISAADEDGAIAKIKELYHAEDIVLDSGDYVDTDFKVVSMM